MHYVHQEGQQVFKYAVRRMSELAVELLARNGLTSRDLALVVPHQANLRIIRAMQERLGVDDSKVHREYRAVREHHGGDDSAGVDGCAGAETVAQGGSGVVDLCRRGVYDRRNTDALGLLGFYLEGR